MKIQQNTTINSRITKVVPENFPKPIGILPNERILYSQPYFIMRRRTSYN
jgi:hypothetical protein